MVLDPKLYGTDVPTFNPPLCGELKATRSAGGRLLFRVSCWVMGHRWKRFFSQPGIVLWKSKPKGSGWVSLSHRVREDDMNSQESGCSKDPGNIAYCIEHTLLKPDATEDDVQKLCREDELVYRDIRRVVEVCQEEGVLVKVIIETSYLTKEEKVEACQLACRAGADFVKTSTGLGPGGATVRDVILLRETVVGSSMGVKAAGGIRTYKDAKKMIEAGATRIGTRTGIEIIEESRRGEKIVVDKIDGKELVLFY